MVVADSRSPRDGRFIEVIGHYNPLTNPATINMKEERVVYWLQHGAQPSDTAAKILSKAGLMEQAGRAPVAWSGKTVAPGAKKQKAMAAAAAAPAPAPAAAAPAPAPAAEAPAEAAPAAEAPPEEPASEDAAAPSESESSE